MRSLLQVLLQVVDLPVLDEALIFERVVLHHLLLVLELDLGHILAAPEERVVELRLVELLLEVLKVLFQLGFLLNALLEVRFEFDKLGIELRDLVVGSFQGQG